jgi:hypothetical protein
MIDLAKLERARMLAAEQAVIDSIPKKLRDNMERAQAKFEADGGCPGCRSKRIGVHYMPCSTSDGDLY